MEATIEISNLHKRFGATVALDGMTFTVAPGEMTGFVGPNGAGKSTTMRVILGLDAPDAGSALIGGQRYTSPRHPVNHAGSLLDASVLQPSRSARNRSGQLKPAHADRTPGAGRPRGGTGADAARESPGYGQP